MQSLSHATLKHGFTTHAVPLSAMVGLMPLFQKPRVGQLLVAEVLQLGKHTKLESREATTAHIFPGDRIVGAFGNRYATDHFEGYVPDRPVDECDMLSVAGVCGVVVSRHADLGPPTRLRVLGLVTDQEGRPLDQRAFGLRPTIADGARDAHSTGRGAAGNAELIVVVGASMNSGKTTVAGTLVRALRQAGRRVAAAKLTGTAAGKDAGYYASCGADPVLDFTDAGYPSTYMLGLDELLTAHRTLLGHLRATGPDYVVFEIADGIFQRETRMLLESAAFRADVDHVFFAANDSLSAACGVGRLRDYGLPLRATSGMITRSPLATREAVEVTGVPCLGIEELVGGAALERLGIGLAGHPNGALAAREVPKNGAASDGPARNGALAYAAR